MERRIGEEEEIRRGGEAERSRGGDRESIWERQRG